ncbi:hypothetical protein HY490_02860 [Candidatus Woesearchaeota archaeon]|nr:hypothetical protein [Candidatus Woesearchaeota archaeon]
MKQPLELIVTMWPEFAHFERTAMDDRVAAIRMNSAIPMGKSPEEFFDEAFRLAHCTPLYLDIKGRQLRVREAVPNDDRCELVVNHPIEVKLPAVTLFKAGADCALLTEIKDGTHLIFGEGPKYRINPGESVCIRDPSLKVKGSLPQYEIDLVKKARECGMNKYMLSYVESQQDIDQFKQYTGPDADIVAKIESRKGVRYASTEFKKAPGLSLLTARGDLFVEVPKPHHIIAATRAIAKRDPEAIAASRILLSVTNEPEPSCADFSDLAFLLDCGYRRIMLCDGLCMKEEAVNTAINIIDQFARDYGYELVKKGSPIYTPPVPAMATTRGGVYVPRISAR